MVAHIVFVMLMFAGVEVGQAFPFGTGITPAIWPVSGLMLAALLPLPRRRWPAYVLLGTAVVVASMVAHGSSVAPGVMFAAITVAEAAAGAWALRRATGGAFSLNRVGHAFVLLVVGALVPLAGSLVAVVMTPLDGLAGARSWWLSNALGILLVAPVAIAWRTDWKEQPEMFRSWRILELAAALVGGALCAQVVFADVLAPVVRVPAYLLPFLIWPAFRFGPAGGSASVLVICGIGIWHTANGNGPLVLADATIDNWILRSQGTSAMAAVSFLLLASMVAERQQALAEIKTLRGFIPICAWCHKVRDDEGFWQRLETYLGDNTDATFSHSICPNCSDKQHAAVEQDATTAGTPWKI